MKRILTFLTALVVVFTWTTQAFGKPNIVFFIADDISQDDFGCYGHPTIKTPNVDALAAGGMRFDNAYLTISSCSPSRCSIITGRYPHNTGAPELHVTLPHAQVRFPELLRKAGYYTVLSGKNHMFGGKDRAFNKITKGGGPGSEKDWVQHVKERPKDEPFFFWFSSSDAHRNWQISKTAPIYDPKDVKIPPYLVDTKKTREDLASYYHEVSRFDHYVGMVVDELKRQGIFDNTLIVVAADNGRPFPRCKTRLYDSGIKTPWVVSYPKLIKKSSVSQSLLSSIDLSATCLELAGIKKPECIQGKSFLPILKNPKATVRNMVFAEQNWHVYKNHSRLVRIGNFAYIKNSYPNRINLCYESDHYYPAGKELWQAHAAGKTTPQQQQTFANPCPSEELYDLSKDPNQFTNLAGKPEYSKIIANARMHLEKWIVLTGDSLPKKPTPDRHALTEIKNGIVTQFKKNGQGKHIHFEMPGESKNATENNHSGTTP